MGADGSIRGSGNNLPGNRVEVEEVQALTSRDTIRDGLRRHVFRIWTAGAVLAAYMYSWLYAPELLTWWKRATTAAIESGCGLLPYPWGDRIEATLGNFGLWVQITLAIVCFRLAVWVVMTVLRRLAYGKGRADTRPPAAADRRGE